MTRIATNSEYSADRSGSFPEYLPLPPPGPPQTAIPFWAKYGYVVAATCLGVMIAAGSMGFSYHQSLQNEHVAMTRRIDGVEYRLDSVQVSTRELATKVNDLVTKEEFRSETDRIHSVLMDLREDLKEITKNRGR